MDQKSEINATEELKELTKEIYELTPGLGGLEEIAAILSLPDEHFEVLAPLFLEEMEKSLNSIENKSVLLQTITTTNEINVKELQNSYISLISEIDSHFENILTQNKKDFIKQMLGIMYNYINEVCAFSNKVINVPIELINSEAKIPTYAHPGDGAVDLYSPEDYTINPGETIIIPCDIKVALPYGYAFLIHPRSGTSAKTKLRIANSIGLVDSQYKGVIGVIVENIEPPIKNIGYEFDDRGRPVITSIEHGKSYYIGKGERFAQMRLVEVPTVNFYQVQSVDGIGEDRGGGFGSSGKN